MSIINVRQLYKILGVLGALPFLFACTQSSVNKLESNIQNSIKKNVDQYGTIGNVRIGYITREELALPHFQSKQSQTRNQDSFGAFSFSKADDSDYPKKKIFFLQKTGGAYMAETKFYKKNNKSYFFSLGIDYKDKTPRVGFRLEF